MDSAQLLALVGALGGRRVAVPGGLRRRPALADRGGRGRAPSSLPCLGAGAEQHQRMTRVVRRGEPRQLDHPALGPQLPGEGRDHVVVFRDQLRRLGAQRADRAQLQPAHVAREAPGRQRHAARATLLQPALELLRR